MEKAKIQREENKTYLEIFAPFMTTKLKIFRVNKVERLQKYLRIQTLSLYLIENKASIPTYFSAFARTLNITQI